MTAFARRTFLGFLGFIGVVAGGLISEPAAAQPYPTRPIEIVIPFSPGGSIDITLRAIAPALSKRLGQPVLIVNKPGGGGTIGINQVAKAAPDGHTLAAASFSFAANPYVVPNIPYDPIKDFEPITMVSKSSMLLLVHPSSPVKTVEDFVAWVKSKPGELYFTSIGVGSSGHLMAELFLSRLGLKMTHVPFTTGGFAPLAQGRVHFLIGPIPSSMPWIKDGRLRAIAVTAQEPDPSVPDIPTLGKSMPNFEMFEWPSLVAPAGTPRAVIDKIQKAVVETLAEPEIKQRLASFGTQPVGGTPEQLGPFIREQMKTWEEVTKHLSTTREENK